MGAVRELVLPSVFVVCASVQQVEDDDAFCRLIYRFTVNKMILRNINQGENTN